MQQGDMTSKSSIQKVATSFLHGLDPSPLEFCLTLDALCSYKKRLAEVVEW